MNRVMDAAQTWTVGRLLDWTARFLADRGSEFPRLDAEVLLAYCLRWQRIDLYTRYDEPATEESRRRFGELVRRRLEGCPVAYLVGRKEFFALELEVSPVVLIPRPESEFVVMECLQLARDQGKVRVLDMGTGSGNIAVAVTRQHPGVRMTAVDISPDALALARRNAARHGVASRIHFLEGDLFSPIPAGECFHFILSNPPYIAHEEMDRLPAGVRDYEPHLALDGGPGGYGVVDRLISQAGDYLEPGGYLILEIGAPQEAAVKERIAARLSYELVDTIYDYSGYPRVVRARRQPQS